MSQKLAGPVKRRRKAADSHPAAPVMRIGHRARSAPSSAHPGKPKGVKSNDCQGNTNPGHLHSVDLISLTTLPAA